MQEAEKYLNDTERGERTSTELSLTCQTRTIPNEVKIYTCNQWEVKPN